MYQTIEIPIDADFVRFVIQTVNGSGETTAPDADPAGQIFRINPDNGSIALDLSLGVSGVLSFTQGPAGGALQTGFYEYNLDLASATYNNYYVTVRYDIGGSEHVQQIHLFRNPSSRVDTGAIPTSTDATTHVSS